MTELTDELEGFITQGQLSHLYGSEVELLERVLARLIRAEEDLENCSDIIANAEF